MLPLTDNLVAVMPSVQWLIVAFIVVTLFAPRLLPVIGRILGILVSTEIRRRLGMPPPRVRHPVVRVEDDVEVIPSEQEVPTLRRGSVRPLSSQKRSRSEAPKAVWPVVLVAGALATVLLWLLLRAR